MVFTLRAGALFLLLTLAVSPAFAEGVYTLRYKATMQGGRFAFDVEVVHTGSGQPIMKSTLRTRPREWGELQTGHAGRTVRVRVMGEANGYAELVLEVRERGKVIQREVHKYTDRATGPPVKYRGEPISLHLREAEIKDVLLAFAEISRTSIAVDPSVTGSVTLDLVDVPWDQALDLILRQHGLVKRVEGKVMFVGPVR
jgi:secretin/TonB-like protein